MTVTGVIKKSYAFYRTTWSPMTVGDVSRSFQLF